jgi:hypothetical protein
VITLVGGYDIGKRMGGKIKGSLISIILEPHFYDGGSGRASGCN